MCRWKMISFKPRAMQTTPSTDIDINVYFIEIFRGKYNHSAQSYHSIYSVNPVFGIRIKA